MGIFSKNKKNAETSASSKDNTWIIAAIAAYLEDESAPWIIAAIAAYLEEESAPVSAMAWIPSESEKQVPWVFVPRIQKRLARV